MDEKPKRQFDEEGLPILTIQEKDWVLANFDKKTHKELTQHIANDPTVDGRHAIGKAIKKFLALDGKTAKSAAFVAAGPIELTDEQKEFVKTNLEKIPKTLEMTRLMFGNEKLASLSREFTAVHNYKKELAPDDSDITDESVDEKTYKPPYNISQIIGKVNAHVPALGGKQAYDYNGLKPHEERNLRSLISYMKTARFIYQATSYDKKIDRDIFEGEMIRFCVDKPDLEPEELSQYISLASYIVSETQATRILSLLERRMEESLKSDDEKVKMASISMAENINSYRQRVEQSSKRQKELYEKLTESRSTKLKNKLARNSSILILVEMWQNQEKREEMIALAERERDAEENEVKRLSSLDELQALVVGLTEEEAILGLQ